MATACHFHWPHQLNGSWPKATSKSSSHEEHRKVSRWGSLLWVLDTYSSLPYPAHPLLATMHTVPAMHDFIRPPPPKQQSCFKAWFTDMEIQNAYLLQVEVTCCNHSIEHGASASPSQRSTASNGMLRCYVSPEGLFSPLTGPVIPFRGSFCRMTSLCPPRLKVLQPLLSFTHQTQHPLAPAWLTNFCVFLASLPQPTGAPWGQRPNLTFPVPWMEQRAWISHFLTSRSW